MSTETTRPAAPFYPGGENEIDAALAHKLLAVALESGGASPLALEQASAERTKR